MPIPYTLGETSFSFFLNGKQHTLASDHPQIDEIITLVVNDEPAERIYELINVKQYVTVVSFGDVIIDSDDNVRFKGDIVPEYLAKRIIQHAHFGKALVAPLIKFAEKLMKNPTLDVREDLYKWLDNGKMPIFADGDFMAYKLVSSEYKPLYNRGNYGQDQSVGQIVEQPRNTCNQNRNATCASGLHFCSYDYLPVFQNYNSGKGARVIVLKINPADVVAIPTDYNLSKGRTCRFEVIGEIEPEKIAEEFGNRLVLNSFGIYKEKKSKKEGKTPLGFVDPEVRKQRRKDAEEAIAKANGNKTAAAKALGIPRSTLYNWLN